MAPLALVRLTLPPGSHQISACARLTTLLLNAARADTMSPPPPPGTDAGCGCAETPFAAPFAAPPPPPAAAASPRAPAAPGDVPAAAPLELAAFARSVKRPILRMRGGGRPLTSGPASETEAAAMLGRMPGGTCITPILRRTGAKVKDRLVSRTGTSRMRCVRRRDGSTGGIVTWSWPFAVEGPLAACGEETLRETSPPSMLSGFGCSTVGEPTLWPRTAPATALVTLWARDLVRMKLPKKEDRGDVGVTPGRADGLVGGEAAPWGCACGDEVLPAGRAMANQWSAQRGCDSCSE